MAVQSWISQSTVLTFPTVYFRKKKEKCYNIFQTVCLDLYISVEVNFGGLMSVETYFVVLHFCTFQNQVADKFSQYEDFNLKPTKL